jgi:hypothetical protein
VLARQLGNHAPGVLQPSLVERFIGLAADRFDLDRSDDYIMDGGLDIDWRKREVRVSRKNDFQFTGCPRKGRPCLVGLPGREQSQRAFSLLERLDRLPDQGAALGGDLFGDASAGGSRRDHRIGRPRRLRRWRRPVSPLGLFGRRRAGGK